MNEAGILKGIIPTVKVKAENKKNIEGKLSASAVSELQKCSDGDNHNISPETLKPLNKNKWDNTWKAFIIVPDTQSVLGKYMLLLLSCHSQNNLILSHSSQNNSPAKSAYF